MQYGDFIKKLNEIDFLNYVEDVKRQLNEKSLCYMYKHIISFNESFFRDYFNDCYESEEVADIIDKIRIKNNKYG
jgi:hypothetical protein